MTPHLRQCYDPKKDVLYETGEDVMLMTRRRAVIGAATSGLALLLTGRQASAMLFEGVPFGQRPVTKATSMSYIMTNIKRCSATAAAAAAANAE
jgi:glycosyltransferase A (GT-A) superfamily protein (DUF2064 family)